jgi:pyruvate/2-oxoacid:ferredoxin oxidoreductase beta subunit
MTRAPQALEAASRLGVLAGQSFVRTGIWPRQPFRTDDVADLAAAWRHELFETVGPVVTARK